MRGLALSLSLLAASSTAAAASTSQPTCAKGLYMVVARGSEEPAGTGVTGNLTSQIAAKVPNSQVVAVDYPATLTDYETSEGDGVTAMQKLLNDYGQACPGSKIAVLGYSQGAQVSMDALCGSAGDPFIEDAALSSSIMNSVVAMAIFGDPTHVIDLAYDRGTSTHDGLFNRTAASVDVCKKYASSIVSYCDTGDIYCDSGNNVTVHHLYIDRYGDEIVDFVVSQYQKSVATSSSSGSNTTTTAPFPTGSQTSSPTSGGGSSSGNSSTSSKPTKTGAPTSAPTSPTKGSGANMLTSSLMLGGLLTALTAVSQML